MADKKISQLTALSAANLAPSTDVLAIVDTSATETKKIAAQDIVNGVLNVASAVGIGTASPTNKLNVSGNGYLFALNGGLTNRVAQTFGNTGGGLDLGIEGSAGGTVFTGGSSYAGVIGTNNATVLQLGTNGTIRATLDTSGNLGIGTASPTQLVHARKDQAAYTWMRVDNQSSSASAYAGLMMGAFGNSWGLAMGSSAANSNALTFVLDAGGTNSTKMTLDSSGNLGIGTASPTDKLNVGAFSGNNVITIGAATTGTSSVYFGDGTGADRYRGYIDYEHTNDRFVFGTSGTGKAYLDSSGNLGLGVTPSAWTSSVRAIETPTGAFYSYASGTTSNFYMLTNAYFNGTNNIYKTSNFATQYLQSAGQHIWSTAPSGTAGNAITGANAFVQAMTLDASGNLMVGTTSATGRFNVVDSSSSSRTMFYAYNSGSGDAAIRVGNVQNSSTAEFGKQGASSYGATSAGDSFIYTASSNWSIMADGASSIIKFTTGGNTERARITAGVYFKASHSGTYAGSASAYHELYSNASSDWIGYFTQATATSPNGIVIQYTAAAPNGTGNTFLYCQDNAVVRATIRSNGGIANYSANDVNLSDERTKKDIAPLGSMWDKFKAIEIVTFKYKDQTHVFST